MTNDGDRLARRLAAIPKTVREAIVPALLKQAVVIADTMRRGVPVESGDLRDSIEVTPPNSSTPPFSQPGGAMVVPALTVAVTAGNEDVRYPHLVEFGHKASGFHEGGQDVPAHPYFWPSIRLHRKKAQQAVKRSVSTAVRKKWSGK